MEYAGIKSMALYRNVQRVLGDLAADGHGDSDPLTVADLVAYDQFHYEGTAAVDDAIALLELTPDTPTLDIGSGLGGPARYVADQVGCQVTALELQADVHAVAESLTERCGLSGAVTHRHGDILADPLPPDSFDAAMSMLCFLHIPDRTRLFASSRRVLRPGGRLFIDDYYARAELSPSDREALAATVYCPDLPDIEQYRADMARGGFEVEVETDMSDRWAVFVDERLAAFRQHRQQLIERHDPATIDDLDEFYRVVTELFRGGRLGGVRFVVRAS